MYQQYETRLTFDIHPSANAENYAFLGAVSRLLPVPWKSSTNHRAQEAYMQTKGCRFVNPDKDTDTKAISIIYRSKVEGTYAENDWYVYQTPVGVSALCKPEDQTIAKWSADDGAWLSNVPAWPTGTFDINVDGMECQFKNDNTNPGALWCKGRSDAISCYKDSKLDKKEGKYCHGGRIFQQPYVYCQW
jgi:hypothetical protein